MMKKLMKLCEKFSAQNIWRIKVKLKELVNYQCEVFLSKDLFPFLLNTNNHPRKSFPYPNSKFQVPHLRRRTPWL